MDGKEAFTNMDPETEADLRRKGLDPHELDKATEYELWYIYANLPINPVFSVYYGELLLPTFLPASDGVDHMSRLSCELRREIVKRLPVKDGARTAVLSTLWREIWLSTPLVLVDAQLLPKPKGQRFRPTYADSPAITAAVSSILEAHPGPFSSVHLVSSNMNSYRPQLERWIQLLAAKGVRDLVLVNRPWPHYLPLPATIFSITTLTRLYLGQWKLPDMAFLRGVSFPHLRELGICCVSMKHGDVESIVSRSPVLEILNTLGGGDGEWSRLRLISRSLRCVQICLSMVDDIEVVMAPRLERLILCGPCPTRVMIGDAPKLRVFGYLRPGQQRLEFRNTIITPGIMVNKRSMVSSVRVLSLNVRFGVRDDVKMVPTFLRCFPNVGRLHILSEKCDKPTGYLTRKFWKKSGPIENVVSRIKVMTLREFRGEPSEVGFLEFFFQSAQVLKIAAIMLANTKFTKFSRDELSSKVVMSTKCMASNCAIDVYESTSLDGGEAWNLQAGGDLSYADPF